jgi:hypothetical protein
MSPPTAPPTDRGVPPPGPPFSVRPLLVAGLVVLAVIAAGVAFLVTRHHPARHPTSALTTPGALGPGPAVSGPAELGKLVSAVHAANGLTVYAVYRALGDPAKLGGPLTYAVWQRPPDAREDRNNAPAERCKQDGSGTWTCRPAAGAGAAGVVPGPLDLLGAIGRAAASPAARDKVTTSADVVGTEKVTCYQLAAPPDTYVLCTDGAGTPELMANTTVRYELVASSPTVASSAFAP